MKLEIENNFKADELVEADYITVSVDDGGTLTLNGFNFVAPTTLTPSGLFQVWASGTWTIVRQVEMPSAEIMDALERVQEQQRNSRGPSLSDLFGHG